MRTFKTAIYRNICHSLSKRFYFNFVERRIRLPRFLALIVFRFFANNEEVCKSESAGERNHSLPWLFNHLSADVVTSQDSAIRETHGEKNLTRFLRIDFISSHRDAVQVRNFASSMWIMESILIFLVVILMSSSPALGISQSMSCSMVNGKTICEKQTSQGNSAASFGQAAVGGGQTFQDAYAGAGNPGQWDYGRQTVYGTGPGAGGASGYSSGFRSGPQDVSSGIYTSSSSSDYIPGQSGGFAGGFASAGSFPVGGGGFAFGGGYPGQGVATGGFATGGFFPFGGGYPAQPPAENSGAPNQGSGSSQGFNPFNFVFGQGGPGAFAGGFAGFPFGRR